MSEKYGEFLNLPQRLDPSDLVWQRGRAIIDDGSQVTDVVADSGLVMVTVAPGGGGAAKTAICAAVAGWRETRLGYTADDLQPYFGQPVTLLAVNHTVFSEDPAGISVMEGSLHAQAKGVLFVPKDEERSGFYVEPSRVLEVRDGHGQAVELTEAWREHKARTVPALEQVTTETLRHDLPYGTPYTEQVAAIYLVSVPGPLGEQVHGSLFYATDMQPPTGTDLGPTVSGVMVHPSSAGLPPEPMVIPAPDLVRLGAGKVMGYVSESTTTSQVLAQHGTPSARERASAYSWALEVTQNPTSVQGAAGRALRTRMTVPVQASDLALHQQLVTAVTPSTGHYNKGVPR